ncbi:hypothetical protein ACIPD2_39580 [Streptomyces griseofuscus]|uniref:hypothetical protein n=1 Tax=Streptomyces griseofuscus TaxID=146922 RepID=UPI00380E1D5B
MRGRPQPSDRPGAQWVRGDERAQWVAGGRSWDAVAISPISRGLDALVSPCGWTRVMATRCSPTTCTTSGASWCRRAPATRPPLDRRGVRVIGDGFQLLMPAGQHGNLVAHWVSPLRENTPPLIRPGRLNHHLRARAVARDLQKADPSWAAARDG